MDVLGSLLPPATGQRLAAAVVGAAAGRRLRIADLQPGDVGVIAAVVEHIGPQRTYQRKRGGEGTMARIGLADASGSVELVLWDDETGRMADGTFAAGRRLILRGAPVKAGYRGGIELGLGSAVVEADPAGGAGALGELQAEAGALLAGDADGSQHTLEGILAELSASRVVGEPPVVTVTADATLQTASGQVVKVVLSGPSLLAARAAGTGSPLRITGTRRNPALDGWYWTTPDASCTALAGLTA